MIEEIIAEMIKRMTDHSDMMIETTAMDPLQETTETGTEMSEGMYEETDRGLQGEISLDERRNQN